MRQIILILVGVLSCSVSAAGQTATEVIEQAIGASLARYPGDATFIKWNADHTYQTLREGTNKFVCYDRSDERDRAPLDRVAQNRRFRAETTDTESERAMIAAAEEGGTRVHPEYGSIWFRMDGRDQESARPHATIAVPSATTESIGLPDNSEAGGAWIMEPGTSAAHIMIPGR